MYTSYGGNKFTMANRSLKYHSPKLFPVPLNLQDMGPLHTTWRYSDLIAVVYTRCLNVKHFYNGFVKYINNC